MKVKKESEKAGLKLNIQKTKIMASGPITSQQTDGTWTPEYSRSLEHAQPPDSGHTTRTLKGCSLASHMQPASAQLSSAGTTSPRRTWSDLLFLIT